MEMKTIAITGASGNLGGKLVGFLLEKTDWNIITFSSQPLLQWKDQSRVKQYNNSEIENILPVLDADVLVHFAFARRFRSNADIASSLDFAEKVYRALYANSKCKLVNISTVGVYAPSDDFIDEKALVGPDTLYGMAKYASEVLMRSVFHNHLGRTTILRLGGVAQSQRILPVFIEDAKTKHEINIVGGSQMFSWIDISDTIEAIVALLKTEKWSPVYNVTLDKTRYLITDVAQMVAACAKEKGYGDVSVNVTPNDIHICVGWTSAKFIEDIGWKPKVSLEETINKMF